MDAIVSLLALPPLLLEQEIPVSNIVTINMERTDFESMVLRFLRIYNMGLIHNYYTLKLSNSKNYASEKQIAIK